MLAPVTTQPGIALDPAERVMYEEVGEIAGPPSKLPFVRRFATGGETGVGLVGEDGSLPRQAALTNCTVAENRYRALIVLLLGFPV